MRGAACAVVLLAALPSSGVLVRSLPDAFAKASAEKPIIVMRYGADFDEIGVKVYESLIRYGGLRRIMHRSVIVAVPTYQDPTEEQKKALGRIMGGRQLPPVKNYPCLMLLNKQGQLMTEITDAAIMHDARLAAKEIEKRLNDYTAQRKLLEKAVTATGDNRFELIMQATAYDINIHEMPASQSRRARRGIAEEDKIGLRERMEFDPFQVVEQLQTMTLPEADIYIRGMIEDGCYSRKQRQQMMAAYAGHVRRSGGSLQRLLALYTEMYHIDPTSEYATYAESALDLWVFKKDFPVKELPVEKEPLEQLDDKEKKEKDEEVSTS